MCFRAACVALMLSCLPGAGCGTVANLARSRPGEGGKSPFGGVRHDVWCIREAANGGGGHRTDPGSEHYSRGVLTLFCAADLPLSLVGDLVTWPYTTAYTFINRPIPTPPVVVGDPPVTQAIPTTPVLQSTHTR
jgi:hypothetical protein